MVLPRYCPALLFPHTSALGLGLPYGKGGQGKHKQSQAWCWLSSRLGQCGQRAGLSKDLAGGRHGRGECNPRES
jgi:hypothetical protein